jgi:Ankyrin repeats (3 copies)
MRALVDSFLAYLQNNNVKVGNRYQAAWLVKQANDFQTAMSYATENISTILGSSARSENIADFIKNIHQKCAPEAYRIAINSMNGDAIRSELPGIFRTTESFSMKNVPLLDMSDAKDKLYLRTGKMPRLLDGRLQLMGHNPAMLSQQEKESFMQGQLAWLEANSVLQISAYILTHYDSITCYYFLRAYYRENFVQLHRALTEKDRVFSGYIENEINKLGTTLSLSFDKSSRALSLEEKQAMGLVYMTYLSPENISSEFAQYTADLAFELNQLDTSNTEKMAEFCFRSFHKYILIHPYLDANYRAFGIFMNSILNNFGYRFIDFHDNEVKRYLDTHFGKNQPDPHTAIRILITKLIKTKTISSSIFVDSNVGKALRNAAANGLDEELSRILAINSGEINSIDSTRNKGWTALHWAIFRNRSSSVRILLDFDARYNVQDKSERMQTPIDICIAVNNPEINQMIVTYIQNKYVKTEDKNLEKVLRNIANSRDLDLDAVKLLVHIGLNINSPSPSTGQTALHIAVIKKYTPIIMFLLAHHADSDTLDKQGKRAIDYAENDVALLNIFSEHQSSINNRSSIS